MPTQDQTDAADQSWFAAFEARTDLTQFGDNALGLFALGLRFSIDDLESVAADAITDGSDDKKCDIVFIDPDGDYAVVIQNYFSKKHKQSAPANKASDLNTAANWLLQRDIEDLPIRIKSVATELRHGIQSGRISRIHFWYVHNLPESKSVLDELKTVETTAKAACAVQFSDQQIRISTLEVGLSRFADWYGDTQSPILVNEDFSTYVESGFEISGPTWRAFVTAIPLQFLRRQYIKHGMKLFSANVRDYLGSISSDNNINNGIKKTAENSPEDFFAFNNGVTILVRDHSAVLMRSGRKKLKFSGISIVNGAQTTGAIASLSKAPPSSAKVSARFIKTDSQEVLYDIIRFNNSQNKVTAADFRSTDSIQRKLKEDMKSIPQAEYEGGRRGGPTDAIRRRPNLLASYTVGQSLAAMHGDATVAYNQRSEIWINDQLYVRYFNDQTTAEHIVFAYSLLRAIESKKMSLVKKSLKDETSLTGLEAQQLAFFRRRGSTYLFMSAIASCLESFYGRRIQNLFRISFGPKISPSRAQQSWSEIVDVCAPLAVQLEEAFTYGLQNQERVKNAIQKFTSLIEATKQSNSSIYQKFAKAVVRK